MQKNLDNQSISKSTADLMGLPLRKYVSMGEDRALYFSRGISNKYYI